MMGILEDNDVEMGETPAPVKEGKKKGVKAIAKDASSKVTKKPNNQKKKGGKPAVLAQKKRNMSELKVLKSQLWMKVHKELSTRTNLIPIHQEILTKLVGRTCVPLHKDRFVRFVESCLKIDKEKYKIAIEELFVMLKKEFKRKCQTAGLQKAAVAATKIKTEEGTKKSKGKVVDRSNLTKSQRKRLRRTERQKLAQARDGVLKGTSKGGKKPKQKSKNSKPANQKVNVQKVKKPMTKVMKKGANKGKKEIKSEKDVKVKVES